MFSFLPCSSFSLLPPPFFHVLAAPLPRHFIMASPDLNFVLPPALVSVTDNISSSKSSSNPPHTTSPASPTQKLMNAHQSMGTRGLLCVTNYLHSFSRQHPFMHSDNLTAICPVRVKVPLCKRADRATHFFRFGILRGEGIQAHLSTSPSCRIQASFGSKSSNTGLSVHTDVTFHVVKSATLLI